MQRKMKQTENLKILTEKRLERAEKLITLTKDEAIRWTESVLSLETEIQNLTGDIFLAAAATSYNGPFTGAYRAELISRWIHALIEKEIPISKCPSIVKSLGNPLEIRDWMIGGLPSDQVSIENSLFATRGFRWPLMIDP